MNEWIIILSVWVIIILSQCIHDVKRRKKKFPHRHQVLCEGAHPLCGAVSQHQPLLSYLWSYTVSYLTAVFSLLLLILFILNFKFYFIHFNFHCMCLCVFFYRQDLPTSAKTMDGSQKSMRPKMMARTTSITMQNLVEIARRTSEGEDEMWCFSLFTGSICRRQLCRYFVYSRADFEVFRPAGATRCTDQGQIWQGGADHSSAPPCQIWP